MKFKIKNRVLLYTMALVIVVFSLIGCGKLDKKDLSVVPESVDSNILSIGLSEEETENDNEQYADLVRTFNISDVPEYSGEPTAVVNNNKPYFSESDKLRTDAFEEYSPLDSLGRCGVAYANVCLETMPTEERGAIGSVKPSGWVTSKYNGYIEGNYLYNRCHLIGYQLAGENANEENLITGTRYMNCDGQLPYENKIDDYVETTGNHVLYRVTPIFKGNNLVASGVLTEAYSVEDKGSGINFCVYFYNVQPGIAIDYGTGESELIDEYIGDYATKTYFSTGVVKSYSVQAGVIDKEDFKNNEMADYETQDRDMTDGEYILNTSSMKIHKPHCRYVDEISYENKMMIKESISELEYDGYTKCKVCDP